MTVLRHAPETLELPLFELPPALELEPPLPLFELAPALEPVPALPLLEFVPELVFPLLEFEPELLLLPESELPLLEPALPWALALLSGV